MYIYVSSIKISTEKGTEKSEIKLDLPNQKAYLDTKELGANAVDWVLNKCRKIAGDVSSGVAQIYESIASF